MKIEKRTAWYEVRGASAMPRRPIFNAQAGASTQANLTAWAPPRIPDIPKKIARKKRARAARMAGRARVRASASASCAATAAVVGFAWHHVSMLLASCSRVTPLKGMSCVRLVLWLFECSLCSARARGHKRRIW